MISLDTKVITKNGLFFIFFPQREKRTNIDKKMFHYFIIAALLAVFISQASYAYGVLNNGVSQTREHHIVIALIVMTSISAVMALCLLTRFKKMVHIPLFFMCSICVTLGALLLRSDEKKVRQLGYSVVVTVSMIIFVDIISAMMPDKNVMKSTLLDVAGPVHEDDSGHECTVIVEPLQPPKSPVTKSEGFWDGVLNIGKKGSNVVSQNTRSKVGSEAS